MKNENNQIKINTLLTLLLLGFLLASNSANAYHAKYAVHTSGKDIDTLKKKSLKWHKHNVDFKKFYYIRDNHSAEKEISKLKNRSLRWHKQNVNDRKFYYIRDNHSAEKEIAKLKNRSLRWHDRNSN